MIKKFTKDVGQNYHNALKLAWLFLLSEIHEYLSLFGAYDIKHQTYNYRRLWWVVLITSIIVLMCSMFLLSTGVYLLKTFGVF